MKLLRTALIRRTFSDGGKAADFGKRRVDTEERTMLLSAIFNNNANKYDTVSSVFALGFHNGWKRELARKMGSLEGTYQKNSEGQTIFKKVDILDTCGGTGDLAFRILDLAKHTRHYRYRNNDCVK